MSKTKSLKMSEELLEMHFMRSTKQKIEEKAKKKKLNDMEATYGGKNIVPSSIKSSRHIKHSFEFRPDIGFTQLQNLRYGRFAFKGVNPEITKIQTEEDQAQSRISKFDDDESIFKDITDEELAKSSFAAAYKASNGRGVMIEPHDQVLNIYTEETTAPEMSKLHEQKSTASLRRGGSPRFAPYQNKKNIGKKY